jgi:uridine phosphorylase
MLKDLTKSDWLQLLQVPESRVPTALILRGTRNLTANYEKHKRYFADIFEVGSPNGLFEDVFIGDYKSVSVAYASVYGDCMASEITHLFGVLGTALVVQTGCCGGLSDGLLAGDLVCATMAHCGEGASQYYVPQAKELLATPQLVAKLSASAHAGPIWTTSALLAEGSEEIEDWHNRGCIAVDMETATTFAVAQYFKMHRASLLFVFDQPRAGDHIALTDHDKHQRRLVGEQQMIDAVLSLIVDYASSAEPIASKILS